MTMLGLAFELRTQCGSCGQALPVNAFTEAVPCGACQRVTTLDAARWKGLLEDAFAGLYELGEGEGKNVTIMTGGGTYQLMYGRQPPRCAACKTAVSDVTLGFAGVADSGSKACVGCKKPISLRRATGVLAELGAKFVVGEDMGQLGGAAGAPRVAEASGAVVLYCPGCKAPLSVDGSKRMVKCQFCSVDVYLPDEVWQRLHPAVTVTRWYAWLSDVDLATRKLAAFRWYSLADGVADAQGNLYCAGEDGATDKPALWCMAIAADGNLAVRWVRDGLDFDDDRAGLALDARGRLLLWQSGRASLGVQSLADGSTLGKLGGREHEGATSHQLDLSDGKQVMVDVDGSILALLGERLVRFGDDGSARPTWPPRSGLLGGLTAERLHPLYGPGHQLIDVDGAYVESVGNHPTELDDYTKLCVGWDGRLYAERSEWVACFDRTGHRVYRVKLPIDSTRGDRIATDGAGRLYVLGTQRGDPQPRMLLQVQPDGSRVDVLATDHLTGGTLGAEDLLIVTRDGTVVLLGYGGKSRVLGQNGRVRSISDKSRQEDAEERKRLAERG